KWSRFHADWSADGGFAAMTNWLGIFGRRSLPGFVVAAQNDDMACGARKALLEWLRSGRSLAEDPRIIGCDGVPSFGHRLVTEGQLTATVVVPSVANRAIEELTAARANRRAPEAHVVVEVESLPSVEALIGKLVRRAP
ncbi:MAG TPA: hypothetical protein VE987_07965, partial [Polyangiaceae bacterium]|nr:hypothetical protein [Polyangiaceae bacterium]